MFNYGILGYRYKHKRAFNKNNNNINKPNNVEISTVLLYFS